VRDGLERIRPDNDPERIRLGLELIGEKARRPLEENHGEIIDLEHQAIVRAKVRYPGPCSESQRVPPNPALGLALPQPYALATAQPQGRVKAQAQGRAKAQAQPHTQSKAKVQAQGREPALVPDWVPPFELDSVKKEDIIVVCDTCALRNGSRLIPLLREISDPLVLLLPLRVWNEIFEQSIREVSPEMTKKEKNGVEVGRRQSEAVIQALRELASSSPGSVVIQTAAQAKAARLSPDALSERTGRQNDNVDNSVVNLGNWLSQVFQNKVPGNIVAIWTDDVPLQVKSRQKNVVAYNTRILIK